MEEEPKIKAPASGNISSIPHRSRWLAGLLAASLVTNLVVLFVLIRRPVTHQTENAPKSSVPSSEAAGKAAGAKEEKTNDKRVELSPEAVKRAGIETVAAAWQSIGEPLEAPGRLSVNADAVVRVGSFVEGRITKITATVGDEVRADQPIVYVHSHEVAQARADYARALAMIMRTEKSLAQARVDLERANRLFQAKAIAERERMQADVAVTTASAELAQARAEQQRAEEFLHHLGTSLTGEDDAVIRAPQAGTVLQRLVSIGTTVTPSTDLIIIADLSTLWAIAEMSGTQAGLVRPGQAVEIEIASFPGEKFSGRVVHLGETLNPETRTTQVRCLIRNPHRRLRPEMYAQIRIDTGTKAQALFLPRETVTEISGERVVFLDLGGGVFAKRPVQTGREKHQQIEITNGLEPGDRVVARGSFYVKSAFLKGTLSDE
jgi:cobalt-zinc-cadmium efflux system membrane fusion protein